MSKRNSLLDDPDFFFHPALAFDHPQDVIRDPDLTTYEKRAILASWASDACAVDSAPTLRRRGDRVVTFDDVVDALRQLDKQLEAAGVKLSLKQKIKHRRFNGQSGEGGVPLQ